MTKHRQVKCMETPLKAINQYKHTRGIFYVYNNVHIYIHIFFSSSHNLMTCNNNPLPYQVSIEKKKKKSNKKKKRTESTRKIFNDTVSNFKYNKRQQIGLRPLFASPHPIFFFFFSHII